MPLTKEDLMTKFHNFSELYEHLANLHEKTKRLCNEIFEYGVKDVKLLDLRLAEIFSLYNTAKLFLSVKPEIYHYEFSSLLSFWNDAYIQIYVVARDSDENTSWMSGTVNNYLDQYEIVEEMLKSKIDELKHLLK